MDSLCPEAIKRCIESLAGQELTNTWKKCPLIPQ